MELLTLPIFQQYREWDREWEEKNAHQPPAGSEPAGGYDTT
jgi:hypothetical protein